LAVLIKILRIWIWVGGEVEDRTMLQGKPGNRMETGCVRIQGLWCDIGEQLLLFFSSSLFFFSPSSFLMQITYALLFKQLFQCKFCISWRVQPLCKCPAFWSIWRWCWSWRSWEGTRCQWLWCPWPVSWCSYRTFWSKWLDLSNVSLWLPEFHNLFTFLCCSTAKFRVACYASLWFWAYSIISSVFSSTAGQSDGWWSCNCIS
jgi:hypothetical protein